MKRLLLAAVVGLAATGLAVWAHAPLQSVAALWLTKDGASPATGAAKTAESGKAKGGRPGQGAPPVTVATVVLGDMPIVLSAPGTVQSGATVAVRPRVDGQIAEILFKEGDRVEQGQVLFRLDDRLIRAQIAQVEATIKRDEAQLADARAIYERRSQLIDKKIVSEAAMDTARANMAALEAGIAAGRASLDAQKTLLDYLRIPAPISGRTGTTSVEPGSNVRAADTTALVTINRTRPASVVFAVPQTEIMSLRRALDGKAKAVVTIPGERPESREAVLDFIDNQVDRQTGTITAKVEAANEDELLWPGLAVDVALTVELVRSTPSVPVSAVLPAQQGMIVWVVGTDAKVTPRPVTIARIVGQTAYLAQGVENGERVVTDGHGRIATGMTVSIIDPAAPRSPDGAKKGNKDSNEKRGDGRRS
jgi:membrane fusion protein, multidrug efflux system